MTDLRTVFEHAYPGKDKIYESIILPIFKTAKDLRKTHPIALAESDKKNVLQASIIAQVAGTFPVTFADVEVQSSVHLKRNRVSIQNCIRKIMEDNTSALIFFHFVDNQNEWRVSFAYRAETLQTSTSAKRYTYLCGIEHSCRTIAERFHHLSKKADSAAITVDDMLDAFSVEALSKEFFAEYKVFYEDFVQYITGKRYIKAKGKSGYENRAVAGAKVHTKIFAHFQQICNGDEQKAEKKVRDYIKKMMGRLVFIQFLQKKGWLGCSDDNWNDGDRDYLQHLFEKSSTEQQNNFLSIVLDPLFFGMLNTNPEERKHHFKKRGWDAALLDRFGKVPYLNGGLFEEDPEDSVPVIFPAVLFGNPKQKEIERTFHSGQNNGYPYDASCGLLDFFARYNFTIDETDPEDREVGVDPEMLGKIFENLLEDNKDKGAFYTPKEIVQYMCRESLIAYLTEETQDEPAMRDFVLKHEIAKIKDRDAVLSVLKTVKICDPAVGSGAFPMGMLNELFACRMLLEGDIADEENRSRIKKEIVRENIYGVDIEKGAVDIARLRFWLAIIVDEKTPMPLPNLDYKIMQGNSLLESYEGVSLENLLHQNKNDLFCTTEDNIKILQTAISDYYQPKTHKSKQAMKQHISQLIYALLSEQGWSKEHDKLADLKNIPIDANNQFFLWHTWFSEVFNRPSKQGFDIVIGNPPYIKEYENNAVFTDFKKISPYYMGKMDLWYGFACIGLDLLRNKGKLCFIASSQWRTSASAKILRNKICNEAKIIQLIDFGAYMVFETSTQAMILIISKDSIDNNYDFLFKVNNQTIKNNHMLNIFLAERFFHLDFNRIEYRNKMFSFVINMSYKNILDKIEKIGNFKIDDKKEIIQGIIGGPDKAFRVKNKNISLFSKAEQAFIQPFYTTTVSYYTPIAKDSILYISDKNIEDFSSEKYPNIYKKLLKYSAELEGRREVVAGKKSWFSLWWERDESFFKDGKKIVFASRTRGRNFTYTEDKFYASRNCFILKSERINLKYLTALLNSKILTFYMHNKLKKNGDLLQLDKAQFTLMPLYCPDNNIQDKVSDIVTKIIATKKECINSDITIYEQKIDEVIYKLYGLTPKEIVIVESNLSI